MAILFRKWPIKRKKRFYAERFSDDSQEIMAQFGMGVLYEKTDDGEHLRNLTSELRKHIHDNYYWKHHNQLKESVSL